METELNGKTIIMKLGEVEENEHAKWRNGRVTVDDRVFDVGGGWIHSEESAEQLNQCHGLQVSQHSTLHWPGATFAGDFAPYGCADMGDLEELMKYVGMNYDDDAQLREAVEVIQRLSEQCACANV